jgi:hypothetical protein
MGRLKQKCIGIMKLELKDMAEDLEMLVNAYIEKKARGLITNYVFLENLALLKHEMYGLKRISDMLDGIDTEAYDSIEDMIGDLKVKIKEKIKSSDLPERLWPLVVRRLKKVVLYICQICE